VDGENVICLPLDSPQGQFHLARARYVFVREHPGDASYGHFSPKRHDIVHVGGVPLRPFPELPEVAAEETPYRAVVASSRMQALAATQAFAPMSLEDVWLTGAPRNDLLLAPSADLPEDLRTQQEALVDLLSGRPLLLFAPAYDIAGAERGYGLLGQDVVDALAAWCGRHDGVVGFYDDVRDRSRLLARALDPLHGWNLRRLGFEEHVVVDRVASTLVTDLSARAVDFAATGKEVVVWADARVRSQMFHDPEVLPAHVVSDTASLTAALDAVFTPQDPDQHAVRSAQRRLLFSRLDQRNCERLVRRLRTDYVRAGR
jgi:hypothetical protein